jgi:hypothetical protein
MKIAKLFILLFIVHSPTMGFSPISTRGAQQRFLDSSPRRPQILRRTTRGYTRGELLSLSYGELRNVDAQLLFDTWEWCANLGAPAALVAGAVLATVSSIYI